ncbi:hypothetical protein EV359DRAFT_7875, partial [Lentinula novae-zelandiae]
SNQRLGCIPLVIGMPVIITQNFDVHGGIVNGSQGIPKSIQYKIDDQGRHHAISCVITVANSDVKEPLPYMENKHNVVALQD